MAAISSRVDVHSQEFRDNVRTMTELAADVRRQAARVALGGSQAATRKHKAAGKLTARERIRVLLDTGSPFLELSQLAAHGLYGGEIAAAGIVTGIGRVSGRECVIVANDPTVKGGTYYPITVKKHLRGQEIARDNRLPCVYPLESGALDCTMQKRMQLLARVGGDWFGGGRPPKIRIRRWPPVSRNTTLPNCMVSFPRICASRTMFAR